jgi:amylosucrase
MPENEESGSRIRDAVVARLRDEFPAVLEDHPMLERRLRRHFEGFWIPYHAVYGDHSRIEKRVWRLFRILAQGLSSRDAHLIERDEQRDTSPPWFQDESTIGMKMYVDLFAGDLNRLRKRVDYLRELHISYLHLMPLMKTRNGCDDGGFAVSDYRRVKPSLGTVKQLRTLVHELHRDGISVALDLVMNHTSCEHKWARKAAKGSTKYQAYYFMFEDGSVPEAYEQALPSHSPGIARGRLSWMPVAEKWVWTTFHEFQWDLNYANPNVFEAMWGEMVALANLGADVLRLNAVPFIWKRQGTDSRNQPETVLLVAAYRALMQVFAPAVAFNTDMIDVSNDTGRFAGVQLESTTADIIPDDTLMSHLWHAIACENVHLLRSSLSTEPDIPPDATRANYIRSHDAIGWSISDEQAAAVGQNGNDTRRFCTEFYSGQLAASYSDGYRFVADAQSTEAPISGTAAALAGLQKAVIEKDTDQAELAIKRLLLLNGIAFFMRGFPLLYSGDEIGQLNDFSYLDDPDRKADNRWLHRRPMNWREAGHRDDLDTVAGRLFSGIRTLADVRRTLPVLHGSAGQKVVPVASDSVLVVRRHSGDDEVLMLANFSRQKQKFDLEDLPATWLSGRYHEQITGSVIDYSHGGQIVLAPYECLWIGHPENGPGGEVVAVDLSLRVETEPGELVYLSGNIPQLGEWSTDRAFGPLDATDYPIWKGTILAPPGTVFEFVWLKRREREVVEIETASRVYRVDGSGGSAA